MLPDFAPRLVDDYKPEKIVKLPCFSIPLILLILRERTLEIWREIWG